ARVADCPSGLVTMTSLTPADPVGVVAVSCMVEATLTLVAAVPPMVTVVPVWKLAPVRVTTVPPLLGPLLGVMALSVGRGRMGKGLIVILIGTVPNSNAGELLSVKLTTTVTTR